MIGANETSAQKCEIIFYTDSPESATITFPCLDAWNNDSDEDDFQSCYASINEDSVCRRYDELLESFPDYLKGRGDFLQEIGQEKEMKGQKTEGQEV